MKHLKKILSMMIVIAMITATFSGFVFADDAELISIDSVATSDSADTLDITEYSNIPQYGKMGGYLSIGDSFARGVESLNSEGLETSGQWQQDENYPDELDAKEGGPNMLGRNIENSYSKIVADAVGCNSPDDFSDTSATYWPVAMSGQTLAAVLDLIGIEDNYYDDVYYHHFENYQNRYIKMLYTFGGTYSTDYELSLEKYGEGGLGVGGDIRTLLNTASLITIELGLSDIIYRSMYTSIGNIMGQDEYTTGEIVSGALKMPSLVIEGCNYVKEHYTLLLDYIKENNPDATVVILGIPNILFNTTLSDATVFPFGDTLAPIFSAMNAMYRDWAEEYGYIYVDISNIELGTVENDISLLNGYIQNQSPASHPTNTGYAQIARAILSAISTEEKVVDTNIRVDIGRLPDVDTVFVNGISLGMFSVEDNILTVTCHSKLANNLKIFYTDEDGTTMYTEYQLAYHKDEGYRVYRMYTCNDLFGEIKTALTPFKIIRTIKSLTN